MSKKKINHIGDVFEQFDEIIGKNKSPFSNPPKTSDAPEAPEAPKTDAIDDSNSNKNSSTKKNQNIKLYASKSIMNGGIIGLVILMGFLAIGIPAIIDLNFFRLKSMTKILQFIILGLGAFSIVKFSRKPPLVVEINNDEMKVTRSIPVRGIISNLLFFTKLILKRFTRINIPINDIVSISRNENQFSEDVLIINCFNKNTGKALRFPLASTMLEKKDLNRFIAILKENGINEISI